MRAQAAKALGKSRIAEAHDALVAHGLRDRDSRVRTAACRATPNNQARGRTSFCLILFFSPPAVQDRRPIVSAMGERLGTEPAILGIACSTPCRTRFAATLAAKGRVNN